MCKMVSIQRRTQTKKRQLKFSRDVVCQPGLHINDYSFEEKTACWYNDYEIDAFRNEARSIICMMEKGETIVREDKKDCTRGLEPFTATGSLWKQLNRDFARTTVLSEQERQFRRGLRDEYQLSRLYSLCSFTCQAMAGMTGHEDAESLPGRNLVWLVTE